MSLKVLIKGSQQPLKLHHFPCLQRFYAWTTSKKPDHSLDGEVISKLFRNPQLEDNEFVDESKEIEKFHQNFPASVTFINTCLEYGLPGCKLMNIVEKVPNVCQYTTNSIRSNIDQLFELGFSQVDVSKIVYDYPHILNYENNDITETYETWRGCGVHERFLCQLFTENPWLFSISNDEVKRRLDRITYLMVHKINRVTRVLLLCPDIMLADWDEVEKIFLYVTKTLRYSEKDISKSTVLVRPLCYIKMRFLFLERVGVYRRPRLKEEEFKENAFNNPALRQVIDTTDDAFATNVAGVTSAEYEVFQKLVQRPAYEEPDDANLVEVLRMKYDYDY